MTGVVTFTSLLALYQLLLMDSWKSIVLPPKKTRSWIGSLYTFITDHKQICDAHTVDFFDKKSWDNQLLRDWTADLESISDSDFLNPLSTTKCASKYVSHTNFHGEDSCGLCDCKVVVGLTSRMHGYEAMFGHPPHFTDTLTQRYT